MQPAGRIHDFFSSGGHAFLVREATRDDIGPIQALYANVYGGLYRPGYATDPERLAREIASPRHLWIVALEMGTLAAVAAFEADPLHRLGKTSGVAVRPDCRGVGVGTRLVALGVEYLTGPADATDVIYATTRTQAQAPSRLVSAAGFRTLGVFPNAVEVDSLEHLNLEVFLTERALEKRRRKPYLHPPFQSLYAVARAELGLERAYLVTERAPLELSRARIPLGWIDDAKLAARRFAQYQAEQRLSNSFFPFHEPNRLLVSEDGGTEIFVWYPGPGLQSAVVGYRTDRVNVHDLFEAVAVALQRAGAAYVELLVDAYDYRLQQQAITARYIPSAYFPAMSLNRDGLRDDYFVLSRTFRLLDFAGTCATAVGRKYLRAYLEVYERLYIRPALA